MSNYRVWVTPDALKEIAALPGNIRHRVRRAVSALTTEPRPSDSRALSLPEATVEIRRIRLDRWRIIYIVSDESRTIDVVGVRRRPPYDYGDIASLVGDES